MSVTDLRKLLMRYAMYTPHVQVINDSMVNAGHRVEPQGHSTSMYRHEVSMIMPAAYPLLDSAAQQMLLFDWLCEMFGQDASLVDHFATKLMERLQDLERSKAKP